jgi:hypothetical protein
VIERFDDGWEYGAYVDGDFTFTRQDVALETVHKLQHYDWVQMYSTYSDLSHNHRPMRIMKSFAHKFVDGRADLRRCWPTTAGAGTAAAASAGSAPPAGRGRSGGTSFEACGRLLDTCILGSGDWHMAFGLVGLPDVHPNIAELTKCGQAYADSIKVWQNRAARAVRRNVGCVDCHAIHHWHGSKQRRAYGERWKILRDHDYDPERDIFRDARGIYQLTADKPGLRDDIRRYFASRVEDDISLLGGDQLLGQ